MECWPGQGGECFAFRGCHVCGWWHTRDPRAAGGSACPCNGVFLHHQRVQLPEPLALPVPQHAALQRRVPRTPFDTVHARGRMQCQRRGGVLPRAQAGGLVRPWAQQTMQRNGQGLWANRSCPRSPTGATLPLAPPQGLRAFGSALGFGPGILSWRDREGWTVRTHAQTASHSVPKHRAIRLTRRCTPSQPPWVFQALRASCFRALSLTLWCSLPDKAHWSSVSTQSRKQPSAHWTRMSMEQKRGLIPYENVAFAAGHSCAGEIAQLLPGLYIACPVCNKGWHCTYEAALLNQLLESKLLTILALHDPRIQWHHTKAVRGLTTEKAMMA
mmetsp:Transcript_85990/g.238185  ORF Transcript_85990/g.238185 Transcript_85990/m.238185 type:complete len:329 (+) Transcript_85990:408-1394(+)